MKKTSTLLFPALSLLIVSSLVLAACGGGATTAAPTTAPATTAPEATPLPKGVIATETTSPSRPTSRPN
ncbi:MAG: hypothetical protein HZB20_11395 [Chloroflexi bacterium]|nr:hypothetical protein [Chloroflexota bacterium]